MFAFISSVFLFFINLIYLFSYFLLLKLVGIQVEVYVTCMAAAACHPAHCALSVLTGQVDGSDRDDK